MVTIDVAPAADVPTLTLGSVMMQGITVPAHTATAGINERFYTEDPANYRNVDPVIALADGRTVVVWNAQTTVSATVFDTDGSILKPAFDVPPLRV